MYYIIYITTMDKDKELNHLLELYLESLSEKEMKAYSIAKSHLGTSFQLKKSVGFLKWKATKQNI